MPGHRRSRRATSAQTGCNVRRIRITGNWTPMSAETMALLNGIHRPRHMIDAELACVNDELRQLVALKTCLERRLNELRIEEVRLQQAVLEENGEESEGTETPPSAASSGYDSVDQDYSPK